MSAALECGNCGKATRRRYACPCGLGDCRVATGVCGACRRGIERKTAARRGRSIPEWLDLDRLTALLHDPDPGWEQGIACGNEPMATFFPTTDGGSFDFGPAAEICEPCPVKHECLAAHLPTMSVEFDRQSGCYIGGTTPAQRVAIRAALRRRAA